MMELQDRTSLSLVLGQTTGEKKTNEKGKGEKFETDGYIHVFFQIHCGDTCVFLV